MAIGRENYLFLGSDNGKAVVTLSADGKIMRGSWAQTFATGGGSSGAWATTRSRSA